MQLVSYIFYAVAYTLGAIFLALFAVLVLQAVGVLKKIPFNYNVRNLFVRWRLTLMTALAFTMVVGLNTVMLAFVNGMYELTANSGVKENVIVLADGATDELFSNLGYGDIKEIELRDEVAKDEDGKPLASWELYVLVNQPILTRKCPSCGKMVGVDKFGRTLNVHGDPTCPGSQTAVAGTRGRRFVQVRGIENPVLSGKVHNMNLHPGGAWFGAAGVQPLPGSFSGEQANEAVLGEGLARELGGDAGKKSLEVGDVFELGIRKWIVVGIMKSTGTTFDSEVWAKFAIAGSEFGKSAYTSVVLKAKDAETAESFAKDLSANYKKPAVTAKTEPEYYASLNTTNLQFLIATIIMMVIMAIGGVFGIMNTMFAAIAQRTKDLGVMRIIGFAPWQLLVSFFLEAILLALIGGLLGCALGSLAHGWSTTSIASSGAGGGKSVVIRMVVDMRILAAGMMFSLVMGCVGGLIPALSVMRLKPLDAVR